ncbi:hypothetical protein VTO73DRAFT_6353 [Trametes versicolor]
MEMDTGLKSVCVAMRETVSRFGSPRGHTYTRNTCSHVFAASYSIQSPLPEQGMMGSRNHPPRSWSEARRVLYPWGEFILKYSRGFGNEHTLASYVSASSPYFVDHTVINVTYNIWPILETRPHIFALCPQCT